jgi:hypothetical protein
MGLPYQAAPKESITGQGAYHRNWTFASKKHRCQCWHLLFQPGTGPRRCLTARLIVPNQLRDIFSSFHSGTGLTECLFFKKISSVIFLTNSDGHLSKNHLISVDSIRTHVWSQGVEGDIWGLMRGPKWLMEKETVNSQH